MKLLLILALCLSATLAVEYGVSYPASYQPAYYPPPTYYETYDIKTDYKDANGTRRCGVLPTVHRVNYDSDRVAFGQYPWQVAIMDDYYNFKSSGGILSPRYIITSAQCVYSMDVSKIRVRVGEYDLMSNKNYFEVYKNYEITVCKKHPYYNVPKYSYGYDKKDYGSYDFDVVILELSYDIDFDVYPHVGPVCIPDFYYLSKTYYNEYSYGKKGSSSGGHNNDREDKDLECWVAGWQESPYEKFTYKEEKAQQYGYQSYSYQPNYYETYEYSQVLYRAKVNPSYDYYPSSYPSSYGYSKNYKTVSWDADYYYDACHGDVGAPIFCLVSDPIVLEAYYPPSYYPTYSYPPSYSYNPPYSYTPSYNPPSYTPSYYKKKRSPAGEYYSPQYPQSYDYTPSYSYTPPSYTPTYTPSYNPPYSYTPTYTPTYTPSYTPPYQSYDEKYPIKAEEPYNVESRRAVLYGVVSYGTSCSTYGYGNSKKITATSIHDILGWVWSVIHKEPSCYSYSYSSY